MAQSGLDFVAVGQHYVFAKTVGETDVTLFAGITGDFSDTHINDQYMKEKSNLGRRIAHGALLVGYMSTVSTISIAHVIHKEGLSDFPVSSGYDRVRFNPRVLYVYNDENPLNLHRLDRSKQIQNYELVRRKRPFARIDSYLPQAPPAKKFNPIQPDLPQFERGSDVRAE